MSPTTVLHVSRRALDTTSLCRLRSKLSTEGWDLFWAGVVALVFAVVAICGLVGWIRR